MVIFGQQLRANIPVICVILFYEVGQCFYTVGFGELDRVVMLEFIEMLGFFVLFLVVFFPHRFLMMIY